MANKASSKKMVRKIVRRTEINKSRKTAMRTLIKRVLAAVQSGEKQVAQDAFKAAEPAIMRAAQKGLLHKNMASRTVSRLNARVKALG